jgi:hypothetical protein
MTFNDFKEKIEREYRHMINESKTKYKKNKSKLSFEEKLKILVQLQEKTISSAEQRLSRGYWIKKNTDLFNKSNISNNFKSENNELVNNLKFLSR